MPDLEQYRPLFLREARKRIVEGRRLLDVGQDAAARMCFHTLRGMSGTMRYPSVSSLAAALEEGNLQVSVVECALSALLGMLEAIENGQEVVSVPALEAALRQAEP